MPMVETHKIMSPNAYTNAYKEKLQPMAGEVR